MEVGGGDVDGAVERVYEGGIEGSEGELVDDVGEVESWYAVLVRGDVGRGGREEETEKGDRKRAGIAYNRAQDARRTQRNHDRGR